MVVSYSVEKGQTKRTTEIVSFLQIMSEDLKRVVKVK